MWLCNQPHSGLGTIWCTVNQNTSTTTYKNHEQCSAVYRMLQLCIHIMLRNAKIMNEDGNLTQTCWRCIIQPKHTMTLARSSSITQSLNNLFLVGAHQAVICLLNGLEPGFSFFLVVGMLIRMPLQGNAESKYEHMCCMIACEGLKCTQSQQTRQQVCMRQWATLLLVTARITAHQPLLRVQHETQQTQVLQPWWELCPILCSLTRVGNRVNVKLLMCSNWFASMVLFMAHNMLCCVLLI